MTTWEYHDEMLYIPLVGRDRLADWGSFRKELNDLGKEGWEAFFMTDLPGGFHVFFKRPR